MTGDEYQTLAMRTNDNLSVRKLRDRVDKGTMSCYCIDVPEHDLAQLVCGTLGMCGESGEVADYLKKYIFHEHPLDLEIVKKELGDVLWYIALCCDAINISIDEIMQINIDKLKKRYPDGFSKEASINRKD